MAVAASGCQLTDLDSLKRYLEITDATQDDLLQQIINHVSAFITKLVHRTFCAADYVEFTRFNDANCVVAKNWPIIHVNRIAFGSQPALRVRYSGSAIRAQVSVTEAAVRLMTTTAAGASTVNALTFATSPTFSTMATAIAAVSGWTVEPVLVDGLCSNLYPLAGQPAKEVSADLMFPDHDIGDYQVMQSSGIVRIGSVAINDMVAMQGERPSIAGQVMLEYRAGYETIPQDVAYVAIEAAAAVYANAGDPQTSSGPIQSESIGDYSYTVASSADAFRLPEVRLTGDQAGLLAAYRNHAVGGAC